MAPAALTTSTSPTATVTSHFALTTTFTAPTQCAQSIGGLTMLQNDGFRIWLNAPLPVPGTTIMSCYPSQFASSFLLQTGGVSQAAFSPLVCPQGYTTQGPFTSNYIACCPSGWDGFAPAANAPSDRPAFGGTCFTNIFNKPIQITSYDLSAIKASSIFTATGTADQAFAYPYEGFALRAAVLASTVPTIAASTTDASSTATSTSSTSSTAISTSDMANNASHTSNTIVLVGVIAGCIVAVLLLATLIMFALSYRKKRMLPPSSRNSKSHEYPDYAVHIRLNNDSPTPMTYLSQPPKVVTDWNAGRRDRGLDQMDVKRYEAGELEGVVPITEPRKELDSKETEVIDIRFGGIEEWKTGMHELEGDGNISNNTSKEASKKRQTVYELDAAVDAMMGEMFDMMKSKKLPALPVPNSPVENKSAVESRSPLDKDKY